MSLFGQKFRLTMTMALLSAGAVLGAGYARTDSEPPVRGFGAPHQRTMLPHKAAGIDEDVRETNGAVSVLPNGRSCPADIGVLDRPPAVAPATPIGRMRSGAVDETGVSNGGCRPTAPDTNPPSILSAPPNGALSGAPNPEVAHNGPAGAIVIGP